MSKNWWKHFLFSATSVRWMEEFYGHIFLWAWWRHQMERYSALLTICVGNSPVPGEFPAQGPVTRSFDVFFDLRLNKRLSKQSWGWWFETLSRPLCAISVVTKYSGIFKFTRFLWKDIPRYWPFVWGIHRSPVNSPHKDQWRGALMFSLICVWINGWVNNREAGDLRRYRAHYAPYQWLPNIVEYSSLLGFCGKIFRVTDHLCGEFTGPRWIPRTRTSDAELWCFLWSASQ